MSDTANRAIVKLNSALNRAWQAIQANHDCGDAVVIIQSNGKANLGHHCDRSWHYGEKHVAEVVINADHLNRDAADVMETLLHESAHGINAHKGIRDTSRQGRWHSNYFAEAARAVGLTVVKDEKHGFTTQMTDELRGQYAAQIEQIAAALVLYRPLAQPKRKSSEGWLRVSCGMCVPAITMRMSRSTYGDLCGRLFCPYCGGPFLTDEDHGDNVDDLRQSRHANFKGTIDRHLAIERMRERVMTGEDAADQHHRDLEHLAKLKAQHIDETTIPF